MDDNVEILSGIERFANLKELRIYNQRINIDYSNISGLNNLKTLEIVEFNHNVFLKDIPQLESLERFYFRGAKHDNELLKLKGFSNLKHLNLSIYTDKNITLDISENPKLEHIWITVSGPNNLEDILGIEEAKYLERINILATNRESLINEIKNRRPDIDIR